MGQNPEVSCFLFKQQVEPEKKRNNKKNRDKVQPVAENMRLEMVIGMQTEILDGHPRSLFEQLIEKNMKNFDHREFRFPFRRAFRVSSSRELAVNKGKKSGPNSFFWTGLGIACSYTYVFGLTYFEQAEGNRTDLTDLWRGDQGLATGTMAGPAGLAQVLATPKKCQNCVHEYILSIQEFVQLRHFVWGVHLGLATFVAFVVPAHFEMYFCCIGCPH